MIKTIGGGRRAHLYIDEWMAHKGKTDQKVAEALETSRTTIWRWRTQQHRLTPSKIAALAWGIGCNPEDLWRLPARPSLDAMVHDVPDDTFETAMDVVRRITSGRKAS